MPPSPPGFFGLLCHLLEQGSSSWPKRMSLCHCIYYQGLNNFPVKNRYPLPLVSSAFKLLKGTKVFLKLDLRNTYHLVRKREKISSYYAYLLMPFGVINVPTVFQVLVNNIIHNNKFVYINETHIFSLDKKTHTGSYRWSK